MKPLGKITGSPKNRMSRLFLGLLLATSSALIVPLAGAADLGTGAALGSLPAPRIGLQVPVPVDASWIEFSHLGPDTFAMGCLQGGDTGGLLCTPSSVGNSTFGGAPPWTFTAPATGATLTVTDAFLRGEMFEVFDFGISIGTTSVVSPGGSCGDNPDDCVADPLVSHAVFTMPAGPHEITIKVTASAFGVGAAYFRVAAPSIEGCGSGYWKKHPASWPPTGYSVSQTVASVFSAAAAYPAVGDQTLMQSLETTRGSGILGSVRILVRAAVTAVLNASDPAIDYPRTVASVLSDVDAALASNDRGTMVTLAMELEQDNKGEGGCPLD